jgi:Gluconate 2-dehydrogenase subunit 3
VPIWLTDHEHAVISAAADRLIPPHDDHPGGAALGVADYIDGLLGAFEIDPPRIWAGGPFSGRAGGEGSFEQFMELSALEELAWRTRIEGSKGMVERERNGAIIGWQQQYRDGIAELGRDFLDLTPEQQDERLAQHRELKALLYAHACEGAYAAPEYGGNRGLRGWAAIQYDGDVQPRGYTDEEVAGRA